MSELIRLPETPSTHDELRARWRDAGGALPSGTAIVTDTQTKGRGRHGRSWIAPAGKTIALSVLVATPDTDAARERFPWLALAAGLALREVVRPLVPEGHSVTIKWPNDLLVDGRKSAGILAELLDPMPGKLAASVGIGLNVLLSEDELPVPHATSLALAGAELSDALIEELPTLITDALMSRVERLVNAAWSPKNAGLLAELQEHCETVSQQVRASLPGGDVITGEVIAVLEDGRLELRLEDGARRALSAADVERVRPNLDPSAS